MKRKQFTALMSMMVLTTLFAPALKDTVVGADQKSESEVQEEGQTSSFLSARQGDKLTITLDSEEVHWMTSNPDIATVDNDGVITANASGSCEIQDVNTGYTINMSVSAEQTNTTDVLALNYSSTDDLKDFVIDDQTTEVKEIEINNNIVADAGAVSKPDSFTEEKKEVTPEGSAEANTDQLNDSPSAVSSDIDGTENLTAEQVGNYVVTDANGESQVVKVIQPELNQTTYTGAVGQTTEVFITNFDTEVTYSTSDEKVATVDEMGTISLVDGGSCKIYVDTPNNRLECTVTSTVPTVNTDSVNLKDGELGQITVEGNNGNLPVKYEVISGNGTVSETGEITVPKRDTTVVRVTISGPLKNYVYDKEFVCSSVHEEYWEAMQPAIQECLGTPYVFGGNIPGVALDCSAYASYVYRTVGLLDGRLTAQGLYDICTPTEDPQPGDLIFFTGTYDAGTYITHVGIYAGDDMMYHSGDPNQKTSIETSYWQSHLAGYGTMINESMESPTIREINTTGESYVGYSQEELELIWAVVAQECNTSYEGALAVISCVANRADINYGGHGYDILSQLTAPSQFAYSSSVSDPSLWQARLGGNVPDYVKQAVTDCLENGVRNHSYLNFRANPVGDNSVNIGDNYYF